MLKLPLPLNFFSCPPLTTAQATRLQDQALKNATQLVQKSLRQDGAVYWSLLAQESNLTIHKGVTGDQQCNLYVAQTYVAATSLEQVIHLFRDDTTAQAQDFTRRFDHEVLDQATLYSLLPPSLDRPNDKAEVTWRAEKGPLQTVMCNRDACLLDGRFDFELDGRRGWVRAAKSVTSRCCPDMQHALGLVRVRHVGSGYVLLETNRPGYISIAYVLQCDFGGSLSDWAIDQVVQRRGRRLLDITTFLQEDRLAHGSFAAPMRWRFPRLRQCFCCRKTFGLFASKMSCRKCGEVFCSACCRPWTIRMGDTCVTIDICSLCSRQESAKVERPIQRYSISADLPAKKDATNRSRSMSFPALSNSASSSFSPANVKMASQTPDAKHVSSTKCMRFSQSQRMHIQRAKLKQHITIGAPRNRHQKQNLSPAVR
ncbi:hypothetical protein LEN26_014396 [Aphanomyces euteiches]|nr:hypothetical protein LEN26_014396 [Aphanomyces euteiches]